MSLVGNYYGSSSESESSDVEAPTPKPQQTRKSATPSGSGLGSLLPQPKNNQASSSSSSSRAVVYVDLPTLTQDSDDEDEEKKRAKRQKLASSSGSGAKGLAALLPPPKRSFNFTKPKAANSGNSTAAPASSSSSSSTATGSTSSFNAKRFTETKAEPKSNEKEQDGRELESNIAVDADALVAGDQEEDEEDNMDASHAGPFFRLGAELKSVTPTTSSYKIPTRQQSNVVDKTTDVASSSQQHQESSSSSSSSASQQLSGQQQIDDGPTAVDAYAYPNVDPNAMYAYGTDPSSYYQYYYQQQQEYDAGQVSNASESQGNAFGDLDETAITRLTGKRKGRDSEVQFKTVNQQDILPSEEWRSHAQHIPAPKFVSKGATLQASGLQKKKNNIMALAAQAQSMQDRLDEQFASGRATRNEARRKYGF